MSVWTRRGAIAALAATGGTATALTWNRAQAQLNRAPGDYMSVALRRQVEALKAGLAKGPSGPGNYAERGLVLYDWANAMALSGVYLHPELTQAVARLYSPGFERAGERGRTTAFRLLDQHARTLAALEANPRIVGSVTANVAAPLKVDTYVEFQQTYTVGDAPIRPGGGVVVPNHFYFARQELQANDAAADNFVTARTSNSNVKLSVETYPISGIFSPTLGPVEAPRAFFKVTQGELRPGDRITVTYGDRTKGSRGLKLISVSNSALRFPLWVVTAEDGVLLTPREANIPVYGGPTAGVRGFVSSIVGVGELFTLSVRAEDAFRNLATGGAPGWTVTLNGAPFRKLPASAASISKLQVRLEKPGIYRFAFVSEDGAIRGESDPVLVEHEPKERIYWGETHGHCGFSEGMGLADDYFAFARDEARLDFTVLSEHDLWMDCSEWEEMRRSVRKFERPGEFIAYMGYEWTVPSTYGGHHNVIFRDIDKVMPVTCQRHPSLPDLYRGLRKAYQPKDVVVIPHAHQTADAAQNDPELEPLVEIVSEHGTFEWLGRRYLANGSQLGFVGASDNHRGHPGYRARDTYNTFGDSGLAAVMAPTKQRDAIFDAMKDRRTYATNSARIILRTMLNGQSMGRVVPSAARRIVDGIVHGSGPIESITLVKNGKDHETLNFDDAPSSAPASAGDIVEVRFVSNSEPLQVLIPARGGRVWEGRITVEGARIAHVSTPQVDTINPFVEWARPTAGTTDQVDFRLLTRGDNKIVRLRLEGGTGSQVRVLMEGARGALDARLSIPSARAPAVGVAAPIEDPGARAASAGAYVDQVQVRRIRPSSERDRTFRFIDESGGADGDNYYVRIVQADGGLAWSSPGWVGEVRGRKAG